ncbi:MAG: N-formylglutamate amidohydrolase [Actinobacteria bacterium]|nr:MAG: N-formylglutamate amidohydrolase [Actinomycetota bacterium]
MQQFATFIPGEGPLVAVALHAGHDLRPELVGLSLLTDLERLREEDPHTAEWSACAPTRVIVNRSRFEVDCNRPRERAVYRIPEDAWGLPLWREPLTEAAIEESLREYDALYERMHRLLSGIIARHGAALVLDLHAYNHRRDGADALPAPQAENPDVNLGTGHLDHVRWRRVADTFRSGFAGAMPDADVRENVKFRGGHLAHWCSQTFGSAVCLLAIEFKKTYMDEWSGELDTAACARISTALEGVVPRVEEAFLAHV